MQHILREIAKIAIGLFIADLFCVVWLGAAGFFPLTMLGATWTASSALPVALFDMAVILLLAHYGWHTRLPVRAPSERTLLSIAGSVFLVVALVHFLRIVFGWSLVLGDFGIPLWLSWIGVAVTAYLSYSSFHFAFRTSK